MKAQPYWIAGPWSGRLAVLPRPRGGDWLEDEVRAWRSAGIDVAISTLGSDEISELDIAAEPEVCRANKIDFLALPIVDRGLPSSPLAVADLARRLEEKLAQGKNV